MELNIKALKELFKNTNTSYKYLFFYALIKIIKNDNSKKHISFNKIIREMLIIAWLPSFQFNLNFRKQDQIKYLLKSLNKTDNDDTDTNVVSGVNITQAMNN